jgi:cytochrome c
MAAGCTGGQQPGSYEVHTGGVPQRGRQLMVRYKCGSCHTIPDVPDAHGVVGPPLNRIASREYIAGNFPNAPDVLMRWVMNPEEMKPKTAMPNLGIQKQEARDIVAFLETLR